MARDFNGANDKVDCGSDASVDAFTLKSVALWVRADATDGAIDAMVSKGPNGWYFGMYGSNELVLIQNWSVTAGNWESPATTADAVLHVAMTYDGGLVANNPVYYVDGVSVTVTRIATPVGTLTSDASQALIVGNEATSTSDFDGVIGFVCYDNTLWDAAMVNRHRWWGCAPGGPSTVKVWHPLWTSDLNNKGTGTANGTATGTTMANTVIPRVERCWAGMMGVGR